MSHLLWQYYLEDDVNQFQHLLETATYHARGAPGKGGGIGSSGTSSVAFGTSPAGPGSSPQLSARRKDISNGGQTVTLTRGDINWRDNFGLTILHHAASSASDNAIAFAQALLDHPGIDLYLQDSENGWTALHRAFYFGNITTAWAILERDASNTFGRTPSAKTHAVTGLIKIKDHEGLGPLDLYAATIQDRSLHPDKKRRERSDSDASEHNAERTEEEGQVGTRLLRDTSADGDECYTFGSNRNLTLGFGDGDDRQWPERITLRRPDHLLHRFYREHVERQGQSTGHDLEASTSSLLPIDLDSLPFVVKSRPIKIIDVQMSKLHTAVLTDDPESNLHVCGHGPGGRLGLGHEKTQFIYTCVEGGALAGKRVKHVGLGQNHTLAVSHEGEIFSWGSNSYGQLGYSLPRTGLKDDEPVQTLPRQIFATLKREEIQGVAASRVHSVAFAGHSLFTWGKNDGQLGLVDSDARSLDMQVTPRKVGASLFSTPIESVCAIDRATICLLSGSHDCWVFANYGYAKIQFPLDSFGNSFLTKQAWASNIETWTNHIIKVTAAGDTICGLSSNGEVYSLVLGRPANTNTVGVSTTNPTKIRSALSQPQRIWSLKKNNMAATDVGVDADGSIIITTHEGSVWKQSRRAKIKDATVVSEYRPKDYKFSRISGLTRVIGVRASSYGAYAAVRRDCDVTKTQIAVDVPALWTDLLPLLAFADFQTPSATSDSDADEPEPRFWRPRVSDPVQLLKKALLESKDLEQEMRPHIDGLSSTAHDLRLTSTVSDLAVPIHQTILAARSKVFCTIMSSGSSVSNELFTLDWKAGYVQLRFLGIDPLTLVNFVLYIYTDNLIDYWHLASRQPKMAHRYRTIRAELMKIGTFFGMRKLEATVRQMITPERCASEDFEIAFRNPDFFCNADVVVLLADTEIRVHSTVVCQRCPFFEGMFMGRAGGRWLEDRRTADDLVRVDLKHIDSHIFKLVLRHIYADSGAELFDDIISDDVEDFFDLLMEVLSVANELMLDRLSQICQKVMGRFVHIRNVCSLLNVVAPSSVSEFKDATLEYMCLNLEAMFHAGHFEDLDEDLLLELDEVVRSNQIAAMPFAKSGRAEALLIERHPELPGLMARNKLAKIDAVMLHSRHRDTDIAFRAQSLDDTYDTPLQSRSRRRSKVAAVAKSPASRGKDTARQAIDEEIDFDLDIGASAMNLSAKSPRFAESFPNVSSPIRDDVWYDSRGKALSPPASSPMMPSSSLASQPSPALRPVTTQRSASGTVPWGSSSSSVKKLDLKDIMQQTSSKRVSNLSASIEASRAAGGASPSFISKVSQKERKKMTKQQQVDGMALSSSPTVVSALATGTPSPRASPWQVVGSSSKVPLLKDVMGNQSAAISSSPKPGAMGLPSTPQLTMRQTLANTKPSPSPKAQSPAPVKASDSSSRPTPSKSTSTPVTSTVHSVRHQPRPVEPSIQLSMSDILYLQQAEKDTIAKSKEENAKRSLQDIQAEQEFQAWWDAEERRVRKENGLLTEQELEEDRQAQATEEAEDKKRRGKSTKGGGRKTGPGKSTAANGSKEIARKGDAKSTGQGRSKVVAAAGPSVTK